MQKKLLKELIAEMEKLRVCAGEISREIQEEKLLSSVTVQQMLCGLETVQVLQKDCEEMFRNEGYEVDSVAEMRQALAEYEKKRDEETLLRVKKVLSDFLRLYTDREKAEIALEKEQAKIRSYSDGQMMEMTEEQVRPYRSAFLYAEERDESLLDDIDGFFDSEIVVAAMRGKLFIRKEEETQPGHSDAAVENLTSAAKEVMAEEKTAVPQKKVRQETTALQETLQEKTVLQEEQQGESAEEERTSVPAGVRVLEKQIPLVKQKEETFAFKGAKDFIGTLMKKNMTKSVALFLQRMVLQGCLKETEIREDHEKAALSFLQPKGFLERVYPEGREEDAFLFLSAKGAGLLRQQMCCEKLFMTKKISPISSPATQAEWEQYVSCSSFLEKVIQETENCLGKDGSRASAIICKDSAVCAFFSEKEKGDCAELLFFPNIALTDTGYGGDTLFDFLNKEEVKTSKAIFVLAEDEKAAKEYYRSKLTGFTVAQDVYCNNMEQLSAAAIGYVRSFFGDAPVQAETAVSAEEPAEEIVAAEEPAEETAAAEEPAEEIVAAEESAEEVAAAEEPAEETAAAEEPAESVKRERKAATTEERHSADAVGNSVTGEQTAEEFCDLCKAAAALSAEDPSREKGKFLDFAERLLQERRYSAALLLMYALKEKDPAYAERFKQYSLACGDTLKGKPQYRQSKIQDLFADLQDTGSFYGKVCSEMRALLRPDPSEYYLLKADVKSMLGAYSDQWEKFKDMKDALHELYEFTDNRQEGFTEKKLMKLGGEENRRKIGEEIRKQAEALCNQKLKAKEGQSFSKLQQSLYGEGSDVYRALKIVAENRTDQLEEAYLVCTRFFTDGELSDDRILEVLNEQWGEQTKAFKKNPLQGNLRSTYSNRLRERLELISRWVMTFDAPADAKTSEDVLQYKNRLERCLKKAAESAEQETGTEAAFVEKTARDLIDLLNNREPINSYRKEFFRSDWVEPDPETQGAPVLEEESVRIGGFELWRRVLWHLRDAMEQPLSVQDFCGQDDYGFAKCLAGEEGLSPEQTADETNAEKQDEDLARQLEGDYEFAYMYGRIDEIDKENALNILWQALANIRLRGNFGLCRKAYAMMRRQLDEFSQVRYSDLLDRVNAFAKEADREEYPILDEIGKMLDDRALSVAEEYLNRALSGEKKIEKKNLDDYDYFGEFLDKFETLRKTCKEYENSLDTLVKDYSDSAPGKRRHGKPLPPLDEILAVSGEFPAGARKEALSLVNSFASVTGRLPLAEAVRDFLAQFGFYTTEGSYFKKKKGLDNGGIFSVSLRSVEKNKTVYQHPFAKFGTDLCEVSFVSVAGKKKAKDISSLLVSIDRDLVNTVIFVLDCFLNGEERKRLARELRTSVRQKTVLLIDRALLLYLSGVRKESRQEALLKCALPYTFCNPYIANGAGQVPEEMFFGRVSECARISSFEDNTCLVYGGRQLGKSALLRRAESICNHTGDKKYALYIPEAGSDPRATLTQILGRLYENGWIKKKGESWQDFAPIVRKALEADEFASLILFIDETNEFLKTDKQNGYEVLKVLKELRDRMPNRFKFVLAGLHNVSRQRHENNSFLAQLGDACVIKPFTSGEAKQMVTLPLQYLGYVFENEGLLSVILSHTNYYPGVMHFFCSDLVNVLSDKVKEKGTLPYVIQQSDIRDVLQKSNFNVFIKDRFTMTLDVDSENQYGKIALAMCWLYIEGYKPGGYSVREVMEMGKYAPELKNLDEEQYRNLLLELSELGVFSDIQGRFLFRKYVFFQYVSGNANIGNEDDSLKIWLALEEEKEKDK